MNPFNLEAALRGEPVVTRDGRPVKIAGYNEEAFENRQILGWLHGGVWAWTKAGKCPDDEMCDLFMAPRERKEWVVIWRDKYGNPEQSSVCSEYPKLPNSAMCTIHEITINE